MNNFNTYQDIILTDNYQKLSYKNHINDHITSVLDFAAESSDSTVLKDNDLKFSKNLYWECIDAIYQNNPINLNDSKKEENRILKQKLYKDIIDKLGVFFDYKDEILIETIDFTISNYMDNLNYHEILGTNNPWLFTNNILVNNNLLYSFTDNKDEYKHLLKKNKKESEISKNLTIGVIGKGHRKDYVQSYIKDIYALRNLFVNLLDENNHDRKSPLKINEIYQKFRDLNISENELTNNNIKSWIVQPLKKFTKIGSNKDGFFIIRNEEDLYESYKSHYNNFMGFYKTLERHKRFANTSEFNQNDFDKHNDIFLK
ncbi:hypothetical protein [Flavobacterium sp.]|uniref:hypothetical protein n=1 Tax=Flavobacterium sp. TaxID=239 RepID=UPI003F6A52D1